jgi:hypothetical protein
VFASVRVSVRYSRILRKTRQSTEAIYLNLKLTFELGCRWSGHVGSRRLQFSWQVVSSQLGE